MKVRSGYVSNSSSSSFVLMYNQESKLVIHGNMKISASVDFTINDLVDMIEHSSNYCSDCTEIVANGYENVMSYLTEKDQYGYSNYDEDYASGILMKMEQEKEHYNDAMIVRVEYGDRIIRKLVDAFIASGEIKSIDESEQ